MAGWWLGGVPGGVPRVAVPLRVPLGYAPPLGTPWSTRAGRHAGDPPSVYRAPVTLSPVEQEQRPASSVTCEHRHVRCVQHAMSEQVDRRAVVDPPSAAVVEGP